MFFSYFSILIINSLFKWTSFFDYFFYFILLPLHIFYLCFGFFAVPIAVILATQIIHIRQKDILKRFHSLNNKKKFKITYWNLFLSLNRCSSNLVVDIDKCSNYWKTPLSGYFLGFLAINCYLVYILLFIPQLPLVAKSFFTFAFFFTEIFQYFLIHQCSKVAKESRQIEKVCFSFCYFYLRKCTLNRKNVANFSTLLKIEHFQVQGRLKPYCMKLLDNYRITSKTFYVVTFYTALFFLFVFKNEQHYWTFSNLCKNKTNIMFFKYW